MQKIPVEFRTHYELNSQRLEYALQKLNTPSITLDDIELKPDFIQLELINTYHNELHVNGWFSTICKLEDQMKKGIKELINFYSSKKEAVGVETLTNYCKILRLNILYYYRYAAAAKKDEQNPLIAKLLYEPSFSPHSFCWVFRNYWYRPEETNIVQLNVWRDSKFITVWADKKKIKLDSKIYYTDWVLPQIVAETIRLVDNNVKGFLPYVWDFQEISYEKKE